MQDRTPKTKAWEWPVLAILLAAVCAGLYFGALAFEEMLRIWMPQLSGRSSIILGALAFVAFLRLISRGLFDGNSK